MKIGYARVSTSDQSLNLQIDALKKDGCEKIYSDVANGKKAERLGLDKAINYVRKNDVIVVWKLDRLGRSITHLIKTIQLLNDKQIGFKSLQENIDTTTSSGKLIFHIFGALAEFEHDIIVERTQAGLKAARKRGLYGGRPRLLNDKQIERLIELYEKKSSTIKEICKIYNISKPTLYNYLRLKE